MTVRVLAFAVHLFCVSACRAQDWGEVSGRFVMRDAASAADVVIWIPASQDRREIPVHARHKDAEPVVIHLENGMLQPRVTLCRTNATVTIISRDGMGDVDAVRIETIRNSRGDIFPIADNEKRYLFGKEEPIPVWVRSYLLKDVAYLLITTSPYSAKSDARGRFRMTLVPQGKWVFKLWRSDHGWLKRIRINGEEVLLNKGGLPLEIGANVVLGNIHVIE